MLGKTQLRSQQHFRSAEESAVLTLPPLCRAKGETASNALQCAMRVYRTEGLRGFYRGITASYAGVSETIIHFVIYEALKQQLRNSHHSLSPPLTLSPNSHDFFGLMGAAAVSKTCASCIAYPHGEGSTLLASVLLHGTCHACRIKLLNTTPFLSLQRSFEHDCERRAHDTVPLYRLCSLWSMKRAPWLYTEGSWLT